MNLVEFRRLTECRELLDRIVPSTSEEVIHLAGAKFILDDILEFKIFPAHPDYDVPDSVKRRT